MKKFFAMLTMSLAFAAAPALAEDLVPGQVRLYVTPGDQPNPQCVFYSDLTLVNGLTGPVAQLENGVEGTCEVLVYPNRRAYNVNVKTDECGSRTMTGEGITIVDHRARTCKDLVPAEIIVKEVDMDGFISTLYGNELADQQEFVTEQGYLTSIQAIGGETTGFGLRLASGRIIELDLDTHGFTASFVEGAQVEVTGQMTTVHGVEIPTRKVLVVTAMTAL